MMDAKLRDLSTRTEPSGTEVNGSVMNRPKLGKIIREYKEELKKVSWTTKEELIFFTKIVVSNTFILGLGIYLADLIIKGVLHLIGRIVHF